MDGDKFDSLLTRLGTGRWNIMYFVASGFWFFWMAQKTSSIVYLAPAVPYTCRAPANASSLANDSCSYVRVTEGGVEVEEACTDWDFDTSVFTNTLTSEFGLVCGRAYLRATFQSCSTFANMVTQLLWGYLADRYGRKVVVAPTHALIAVLSVVLSFLPSFSLILTCQTLRGLLINGTLYLYAMEVCEIRKRSTVGILVGLPWALGTMAWGGMGYLIRDWRRLNLASALPSLLILLVLFLDESPRWLAVVGREKQAKRVLQRAARMNKAELPPDEELKKLLSLQEKGPRRSAQEEGKTMLRCAVPRLMSTPAMCRLTVTLSVMYALTTLVFAGINLSGAALSADPFLYMVLAGLMEVPGYTVVAPVVHRWGRKVPLIAGYLACGVTLVGLAFVKKEISWLVLTLAMAGKLAVSGAFMVLTMYQAELQPTEVRLQGKGVVMLAASGGYCVAPYITDLLALAVPWLPSVIFGVASLAICLLLLPLPETLGVALPQTVADFEILWRRKWLSSKTNCEV